MPQGDQRQVMIVDWPEDCVAVPECRRIAVGQAEQAVAVGGEQTAFDESAFPGERLNALGAQDVSVRQILAKVDAARPVFSAGERRRFDRRHAETSPRQPNCGRQPRGPGAHHYNIVI